MSFSMWEMEIDKLQHQICIHFISIFLSLFPERYERQGYIAFLCKREMEGSILVWFEDTELIFFGLSIIWFGISLKSSEGDQYLHVMKVLSKNKISKQMSYFCVPGHWSKRALVFNINDFVWKARKMSLMMG